MARDGHSGRLAKHRRSGLQAVRDRRAGDRRARAEGQRRLSGARQRRSLGYADTGGRRNDRLRIPSIECRSAGRTAGQGDRRGVATAHPALDRGGLQRQHHHDRAVPQGSGQDLAGHSAGEAERPSERSRERQRRARPVGVDQGERRWLPIKCERRTVRAEQRPLQQHLDVRRRADSSAARQLGRNEHHAASADQRHLERRQHLLRRESMCNKRRDGLPR